jgi:hypothetical protein
VKLAILQKGQACSGQCRLKRGNKIGLFDGAAGAERDALLDPASTTTFSPRMVPSTDCATSRTLASEKLSSTSSLQLVGVPLYQRHQQLRWAPGQIRRYRNASRLRCRPTAFRKAQ